MAEVRRVEEKRRNELTLPARLGRQGKRPAVGPAYVVGWIGRYGHAANASAGAFRNFLSAINASRAIHLRRSKVFNRDVR